MGLLQLYIASPAAHAPHFGRKVDQVTGYGGTHRGRTAEGFQSRDLIPCRPLRYSRWNC